MANPVFQPDQIAALTENGQMSQDTANMLNVPGPSLPQNQEDTQAAINEQNAYQSELDNQEMLNTSNEESELIPTPGKYTTRQSKISDVTKDAILLNEADNADKLASEQEPAVDIAEQVIKNNEQLQLEAQQIKDSIDIKNQAAQQKEALKSQIAQEDAIQSINIEEQQKEQANIDAIQSEINKEQQELKNLSMKDIFNDENAPLSKLQAGVAIMLGAVGAGLAGGPNLGLQAVNKTMDDYFQKQQIFGKEKLAKKQRVYDLLKLQLDKQAMQTDDEFKKAKIKQAYAEINAQQQAAAQQRFNQAQQDLLKARVSSGKKLSPQEETSLLESLSPEDRKRYIPGFGFAKDPEVAKNVSKQIDFGEQALSQTKKLRELMSQYGNFEVLDRGAVAAEESTRKNLQLQLKELFNLGVLNGPDLTLLEQFTGGDFFSGTTTQASKQAKLASTEEYIKNRVNSALSTAGLPKMGASKFDAFVEHAKKRGMSTAEALKAYNRLKESGKIK